MDNLGSTITEHRKRLNLTQKELGDKLNVSPQAVSKWENGQAEPDASTIRKLCKIFAISTDELLGIDAPAAEAAFTAPPVTERVIERVEQKIINGYCEMCKDPVGPGEYVIENLYEGGQHIYCKKCHEEREASRKRAEYYGHAGQTKKSLIWGGIAGGAVLIIFLISCFTHIGEDLPLYAGIPLSIYIGYAVFAFVTQMFWDNSVNDLFFFFLKSFKMPGVIFTLDVEGLIFLLLVKVGGAILSFILSVLFFLAGLIITPTYAAFSFPVAAIKRSREAAELKSGI